MSDNDIDIDPLFTGLTRPPLSLGVPIEFFGINFMLFGVGMIAFSSLSGKLLFFALVSLPLHGFAYIATERDPQWMRVWLTKLSKCPPTRNRFFWKSDSYQP